MVFPKNFDKPDEVFAIAKSWAEHREEKSLGWSTGGEYKFVVSATWGRLGGDSGGAVKLGPGLSFSWKRALGVTKAKRRVSKKTGIPLSRGGRRMKLGKWLGMK